MTDSTMRLFKSHIPSMDKHKLEVLCRISLVAFLSFALSVATLPQIIPESLSYLIGITVAGVSLTFPYLLFAPAFVLPGVLVNIIFALLVQTALLAAATVSDGLMVAIYAVYTLWCTSLYFGPDLDKTSSSVGLLCMLPGLFTISYRPLVQSSEDGLAVVKGLWTESGLDNPFAANRNLLIALLWAFACLVAGVLMPPLRTTRDALTNALVPAALVEAVAHVRGASGETVDASQQQTASSQKLAKLLNTLKPSVAMLITFEPRLCRAPLEYTVPQLKELLRRTDGVMLAALALKAEHTQATSDINEHVVDQACASLKQCAGGLASGDKGALDSLRKLYAEHEHDNENAAASSLFSEAYYVRTVSIRLLASAVSWLETIFHPDSPSLGSKAAASNLAKTFLPWVLAPLIPLKRLFSVPLVLLRPKCWSFDSALWAVKFTAGLIGLFMMSIYWNAYSEFAIKSDFDTDIGAVFNGWNLIAYVMAWSGTLEGTLKRAVMRLLGTGFGGFAAWLGIMLCSWSYNPEPSAINQYGLIAYLTGMTIIVAFVTIQPGLSAHFGLTSSAAKAQGWFVMTLCLISLESQAGKGRINDLVINRIVATISGVIMACVVQFIPPNTKGSDPEHTRKYLGALKVAYGELLAEFSQSDKNEQEIDAAAVRESCKDIPNQRRVAMFLLKDASVLNMFPLFKADERLMPLLLDIIVTEAMWNQLLDLAAYMTRSVDRTSFEYREAIESTTSLRVMGGGRDDAKPMEVAKDTEREQTDNTLDTENPSSSSNLFVTLSRAISHRIRDHEAVLDGLGIVT